MKRKIAAFLCVVMCLTSLMVPTWAAGERDITEHESCAIILKQLGLFRGVSETNFDLERAPTRIEALVMLIRVLGKENEALDGTWRHPFTDVPSWADPYVGYAYVNGLTNGVSPTEFGEGDASAANYLTFMLRALGYSDANGLDFTWDNPFALAENVGILVDGIDVDNFWRADVAGVSYLALTANLKGSADTLADKLISAGVFTLEEYGAALGSSAPSDEPSTEPPVENPPVTDVPVTPPPTADGKLNAEQISEKCAPAVFYVEVYGYSGKLRGVGSGFFISADGYAITNFHVAENSSYLAITTIDGKKYDDVTVVDVDRENDLALLKVKSSAKFPYLEIGDSDSVKQGQTVYAIGSPGGLENTLSQGIVSNAKRTIGETVYIQTSAQFTSGSSGGALINDRGEVVGVTAKGVLSLADLNFAVPINKLSGLNKNNTREVELWNDTSGDPRDVAHDFGDITGMKQISKKTTVLGYEYTYDAADVVASKKDSDPVSTCIEVFKKILKNAGYTATTVGRYTSKYKLTADGETGTVTINYDIGKKEITVKLEIELRYYEKASKVPDLGWYLGFTVASYTFKDDIHTYTYKYSDTYTLTEVASALKQYIELLWDLGFEYSGEEETVHGKTSAFIGQGCKVYLSFVGDYLYIQIGPAIVKPQISPMTRLIENLKLKGTHDTKNSTYKYSKKVSKALYDITYFEKTGIVQFGSVETFSIKNIDASGVDLGVDTSGVDLSNISMDVTYETYIYLNPNGSTSVLFIYNMNGKECRFEADFNRSQFSEKTVLTQKKYIGPVEVRDNVKTTAVSQMVRTLNGCGAHLLKDLGVTLSDLGFNNFTK